MRVQKRQRRHRHHTKQLQPPAPNQPHTTGAYSTQSPANPDNTRSARKAEANTKSASTEKSPHGRTLQPLKASAGKADQTATGQTHKPPQRPQDPRPTGTSGLRKSTQRMVLLLQESRHRHALKSLQGIIIGERVIEIARIRTAKITCCVAGRLNRC